MMIIGQGLNQKQFQPVSLLRATDSPTVPSFPRMGKVLGIDEP